MEFRILSSDDLSAFRSLRLEALRETPEAFGWTSEEFEALTRAQLLELLLPHGAPNEKFVLGAFEEDTLVGMAGLKRDTLAKVHHRAALWGVYVSSRVQAKGIGKLLLQALLTEARTVPGLEQLHLTVVTTCVAARRLYASQGFRVYGLEVNAMKWNGISYDEEMMYCPLYPEAEA